ncbi:MAG TPA: OmpA family protein [Woeseiaceae bacterium]|nr:OmpA family protein [Woeseiaceae bacterium]
MTQANPTIIGGSVIDPATTQEVASSSVFNLGEPAFIRLVDSDQNIDYQLVDYASVTVTDLSRGDTETIQLTETGPNTGVFAGFVLTGAGAAVSGDCKLQSAPRTTMQVNYTDPQDGGDAAQFSAGFDPVQRVFESQSGAAVSGASIEIVDAASGLPATVYGNDGVSAFPSSIVSGSTVTDSSGASYAFGPGEYRFPVVADGDYRLVVTPPDEYVAPSAIDPAQLQNLPNAPFELGPGSFGTAFTKTGGLSVALDIPVDPRSESLFLQKRTLTTIAAPGDFVRYELILENTSATGRADDIELTDQLPPGVRFVPGSVTVDGADAPDPVVGPNLDTLMFTIDELGVSQSISITYVVEIIGGKRNQELINRATALAGGGLISNEAEVSIRLTEDLFRSTGTIIGRILEGDCSQDTFTEEQGVPDIRVYLEDGSYAVSDEGGRFHFEGLKTGTHVAQIDTFSVPDYFDIVRCSDTPGFAGRADSQFVKLTKGSLLRADFYLKRKPAPEGRIDLELQSRGGDNADQVHYELLVNGIGNVAIENTDLMIMLPKGVSYEPGSMRIDGDARGEPRLSQNVLSLALPDRIGNWSTKVDFVANIASKTSGELTTRATARFDSPIEAGQTTPVAETKMLREPARVENAGYVLDLKFDVLSDQLSASDKQTLDTLINNWRGVQAVQISTVGHSDSQMIAARNQHLFKDNYVLSRARAYAAAEYVADALGLSPDDLQVAGRGPDEPIADNASAAGRAKNRRVEMVLSGVRPSRPSFLEVTKASSGTQVVETMGAVPGTERTRKSPIQADEPALQVNPDIETLEPGAAMLLPAAGFAPSIPATKLAIAHAPSQTVAVWVNDSPVNSANFDSIEINTAGTVAVSTWKGVELRDGANTLRAVISDADGQQARAIRRTIHFSGLPIRGEVVEEQSVLVADGKTRPVIAVRLYDRAGKLARRGMVGGFRIAEPYRSWWDVENDLTNPLVEATSRQPTYRIGTDGVALIELEPITRTGEVSLHLLFDNYREQELKTWIRPADRDWILVGFAEGTAGYNTLSDNAEAALNAGNEDEYYDEGRMAFFAKGQIKGEFLLTLAYDTDRNSDEARDAFNTVVDPNQYYALYADNSEHRFEAPTQNKLYVKIERQQFYALFGDFDTGLTVNDLSRYQRHFSGVLSEFRGEHVGYSAFAAESSQVFTRDEIPGDGTSGLYRLSNAPIIANSEQIRIEVRDRFDSGVVLESRTLSRFLDYNLNAIDGTLYFKKPVPSRDLNFNPVYIVAEYESQTNGGEDVVAGGRASVRTASDRVEFGVTHINDGTAGAEADLSGVDFRWQLNDQTLLKAEIAETNALVGGVETSGSAHYVELEHNGEKVDVRAYMREVEDEFGLGYQSAADKGVRRLAIDARARLNERWFIEGEAGWQQMLATDDIRNLARAQLRYERNTFTSSIGFTHAQDKFDDGDTRTSDLAELGIAKKIYDGKVTLRASASTALNVDTESLDYPSRFVLGADYRLMQNVDLIAEYEQASGSDIDATMTRLGVRATPWARAQVDTSLTNEVTEYGPRLFANVGLIQGFQISEHWLLDVGVDQTNTILDADARPFDPDREPASGSYSDDFLAVYTGATYTSDVWSANSRIEYRNSDSEERASLLFGWYRQPLRGHGLSAGLTVFQAKAKAGGELTNADLRLGWAYRPALSDWSFLNRLDLVLDDFQGLSNTEQSWRVINNFNANHRFSAAMQLSLQYAFKYVRSEFDASGFTGYTDLIGFDLRRGLKGRWDVGASTSVYHSYNSSVIDYGLGVDVGYNVATNMWLSLGYNVAGFHDEDFAQARYTAQGPFLRFSIKADQRTLKDIAGQR